MSARQHGASFVPDNLLVVQKTDAQQSGKDFARELRRMPDVSDLEIRHKREGLGPVSARVTGDGRFCVALRPMLHVAGFGRPTTIQSGTITPLRIEFDAVRRVSNEHVWRSVAQQPSHDFRLRPISADQPMVSKGVQISKSCDWLRLDIWNRIFIGQPGDSVP